MKLLAALTIFAALALAGCATRTPGRETDALDAQLARAESANTAARNDVVILRSNLSRADGKAAVILRWLQQHRGDPQH